MTKVILEQLIKNCPSDLPEIYKNLDTETFGMDWKLHPFQSKALLNALNTIYYYFQKQEILIEHYDIKLNNNLRKEMTYDDKNSQFELLGRYLEVSDDKIEYNQFLNRASFWMATGSGKTLVLIKLIEILHQLAIGDYIPEKDIMILAPKQRILDQIIEHIDIFNKNSVVKIVLRDLREFEKAKQEQPNLFSQDSLTVFFYRSDNISDCNKTELLNFETVLNYGNWYVLLDEAHKGDKEDSVRQAYYSILAHNGFIFSFSATFTDTIDIVTTAYNFNLKKFIEDGFGKHLMITGHEYRNWKRNKDSEFSESEKTQIVAKSLLVFTAIKIQTEKIKKFNSELYHNPLLLTIANEVNTVDADLKIFFQQISKIANGEYDIEEAKQKLIADFREHKLYQFKTAEIPAWFLNLINRITKEDILKYTFNASAFGAIEYTKISNNNREIAFRLKTAEAGKHFCLLVASEATNWGNNVLDGYEYSETPLTTSYFSDINDNNSSINILLGSRIFSEGWDSNRPNVVNFINIGVDDQSQKFVLQALGRGVRIQPVPDVRKRLSYIQNTKEEEVLSKFIDTKEKIDICKENLPLESLFIFATKKEVIKNITGNLDKEITTDEWKTVKHIEKNKIDKLLLIPKYEEANVDIPAFSVNRKEYNDLTSYIGQNVNNNDKILLMMAPINISKTIISTISKIRESDNFKFDTSYSHRTQMDSLFLLNNHFNQKGRVLRGFEQIDNEIVHFGKIEVANIPTEELEKLEKKIIESLDQRKLLYSSREEAGEAFKKDLITIDTLKEQLTIFDNNNNASIYSYDGLRLEINSNFLVEHYYNPILLSPNGTSKQLRHIIWVPSEVEFIEDLNTNKAKLDKYEWWYFSKIEETVDTISIPYYDRTEQKYRDFYPDFIFWLKLKNSEKLLIKFVDPKGKAIGIPNAEDKAKGFEKIFKNDLVKTDFENIQIDLYFYNDSQGVNDSVKKYFTKDFSEIFD